MNKHIFVISHRRSGTHFTIDAIRNNFKEYSDFITLDRVIEELPYYKHQKLSANEAREILSERPTILKSHMHADYNQFFKNNPESIKLLDDLMENSKLIYVYRDGRDVLTSLYYFLKRSNIYGKTVKEKNFSEFIRMENHYESYSYDGTMNRVEFWAYHINSWFNKPNVIKISFRELKQNYKDCIETLAKKLDLVMPNKVVSVIRQGKLPQYKYFSYMKEKVVEQVYHRVLNKNIHSPGFRKGIVGDYKKHFTEEDLEFFYECVYKYLSKSELNRILKIDM